LLQNDGSQKDNWFHHAYEHDVLEKINIFLYAKTENSILLDTSET